MKEDVDWGFHPRKSLQSLWTESHTEEDTRGKKSGSAGRVEEGLTTERGRHLRLKLVGTCSGNRQGLATETGRDSQLKLVGTCDKNR